MPPELDPQEIYLLERYSSADYFAELRDTWEEMVLHVEGCLESFMHNLKPRYRSAPLPEQPDIVWGHRVIPNFRNTLRGLYEGFIMLSHGDASGLGFANGPSVDFKGQMDYSTAWMTPEDKERYETLLSKAAMMAHCIVVTEGAFWSPGTLSNYPDAFGPLNAPAQWPAYRINRNVSVTTGTKTKQSGIYYPDVENGCAQFLSAGYEKAPLATVLIGIEDIADPTTGQKYDERPICEEQTCTWYLIERAPEHGNFTAPTVAPSNDHLRVQGGEICPIDGFYFTPARPGSRRLFTKGEVMPSFATVYGTTIWQWDADQT